MIFEDRRAAGIALARMMQGSRDWGDAIVLGLPRGGVPVASEVARALDLPLDVFVVRKLGVPGHEELAMGAVASGGIKVVNKAVVYELSISPEVLETVAEREQAEIERREKTYRDGRPPLRIDGRTAIVVDDGLATGASMLAAVRALRPRAQQVVVAVPVAAEATYAAIHHEVDEIFCVDVSRHFVAVGMFYRNFEATTDDEVRSLLAKTGSGAASRAA